LFCLALTPGHAFIRLFAFAAVGLEKWIRARVGGKAALRTK